MAVSVPIIETKAELFSDNQDCTSFFNMVRTLTRTGDSSLSLYLLAFLLVVARTFQTEGVAFPKPAQNRRKCRQQKRRRAAGAQAPS